MKLFALVAFAVLCAGASAQPNPEIEAPPSAEAAPTFIAVVPVVANTIGVAGVNWRSEVVLQNSSSSDAEVLVTMPGIEGSPFFLSSIGAGQTLYLGDVVRETFGLPAAIGPLVVQTTGDRPASVGSVIRALKPDGEATPQTVPIVLRPFLMLRQLLQGLEVSAERRTNLGLSNLGDVALQFSLGLQVVPGRFVETASFTVAPYTTLQLPLQEIFPVLARGAGLRVVVEPAGPNGFAYASVIENATSNGRFVIPAPYEVSSRR